MVTRKNTKSEKELLNRIAKNVRSLILEKKKYSSLDAYALEFHDLITKPTLYQICEGKRDMKISTLLRLAKALNVSIEELLK